MKKKFLAGLVAGVFMFGMAGMAQASLTTIGKATYGPNEYNLIWDDDNNGQSVVWLDYSHTPSTWENQKYWAEVILGEALIINIGSSYDVDWGGSSWRLPSAGVNPTEGYNLTSSEMGHLFYTELGLQSYEDRGKVLVTNAELNAEEFDNLIAKWYWSGTSAANTFVWGFNMALGLQNDGRMISRIPYGLAIRNGQVSVVPVPGAIWLFGSGLAGLLALNRRRK